LNARPLKIVRTADADRDVAAAAWYIEQQSPQNALLFVNRVRATLERLASGPYTGRPAGFLHPDVADIRVRCVIRTRTYLVFYRVTPEAIEVMRIIHAARDWRRLLERPRK
jgi:toxin ParE1/3/4